MSARQTASQNGSVGRIAGLTLVNAMIFQEILADYQPQVQHLRQTLTATDIVTAVADHWQFIVTHINYHPIFHVAHELLVGLPSNPDTEAEVRRLAQAALDIVRQRAALRHDLMGRVYHKLLANAKYLGTFYTSVPAATLLLKLALNPDRWSVDWQDVGDLSTFRVGDLACGTGTLLMAAAEAVVDNYLRACGAAHTKPQMDIVSRLLMEDVVYGYDVLASALHLTASTLALRAPDVTFRLMHLYVLPLGGRHKRLGSIEFLRSMEAPITTDLFGASTIPGQVSAKGDIARQHVPIPGLNLCVMNPPFTRSVGGNLLFGSLPEKERAALQKELAAILRQPRIHASSTAGLGSVFVATGDMTLKPGGRMALVLPKALLSGVAWQETRELFRLRYQLEYLVASHDPARWNFSENTDLSEVLVVARKLTTSGTAPPPVEGNVLCINLWKNPATAVEALAVAHIIERGQAPDLESGQGALEVTFGDSKVAEVVGMPWGELRDGMWMLPCAYAQSDLLRAAYHLSQGTLFLPGRGAVGTLPLCPLIKLASLGPDRRDIHDGFRLARGTTSYPTFWGHDASTMTTIAQTPNRHLSPRSRPERGRPLRKVTDLWPKAGSLLLAERLRLNTQRLAAVRTDASVLSNVWWPARLHQETESDEKALALWLNSTLALVLLLAHRQETQGAWVDFKKPTLSAMPVLDIAGLGALQKQTLVDAYDRLCSQPLLPFPQMAGDPVRRAIDEAVTQALSLPDVTPLRELLGREPVVCLQPIS
ncbi:MAG: hypothetical protein Q8O40_06885 [Chloroflexota bacterium]|nr:hypothetical protein [Chloroflexota bacterium]